MARLAELEARLASIGELDDVIGAMRALAAVRMRQATDGLRAARTHAEIVRSALEAARELVPDEREAPATTTPLLVAFCTEHGFAGAFNERVLERAGNAPLIVVGSRGALVATERRLQVVATLATASHPSGVLDVARRVAGAMYEQLARTGRDRVDVVFGRSTTMGAPTIERAGLLPVERAQVRSLGFPPFLHDEPALLIEQLTAELVISELARSVMESLAAESSARMQAMSAAHDNIERKLGELRQAEHRARQDEVTTELLDLVTGVEAAV